MAEILKGGYKKLPYEPVQPLPEEEKAFPQSTPIQRFGKGMLDIPTAVKQLWIYGLEKTGMVPKGWTQSLIEELASDEAMYQKTRGEDAGSFDFMRILGQSVPLMAGGTLAPLRAAGAGYKAIAGESALMGVATGLLTPAENPNKGFIRQKAEQVVGGAVAGGVLGPAMTYGGRKFLSPLGRKAYNFLARYASTDKVSPAAIDQTMVPYMSQHGLPGWYDFSAATKKSVAETARKQLDAGVLDETALVRQAVMAEVGVKKPTLAQLTRDPAQWRRLVEIAKLDKAGEPVRQRIMEQRQQLGKYAESFGKNVYKDFEFSEYPQDVMEDASLLAFDTIKQAYKLSQKAVSEAYDAIPEEVKRSVVNIDSLKRFLYEDLAGEEGLAPIIGATKAKLERDLERNGGELTIGTLANLRKEIGSIKLSDPTSKWRVGQIKEAIDDAITGSLGENPYAEPIREASRRFTQFGNKMLKAITGETAREDTFVSSNILRNTSNGVLKIKTALTNPDIPLSEADAKVVREEGMNAWNALKGAVFNHIMAKGLVKEGDIVSEYSGAKIAAEIKRIGLKKLGIIFEPDELERLMLLREAGIITTRPPADAAINTSNTGSNIVNYLMDTFDTTAGIKWRALGKTGYAGMREGKRLLTPESAMPSPRIEKGMRLTPPMGVALEEENKR